MERVPIEGWITEPKARQLLAMSGQSFEELKKAAASKDFKPVKLKAKGTFTVHNTVRHVKSKNVVARLPGADPELANQYVIHTAHWDHLGRDPKKKGDQIYNGAVDNASGTAGLLELARAYTRLPNPPRRSILFIAVTSEEKGLLGSKWYASHPLYPLEKTVAEFNFDGVNPWGRTSDLVVVGKGQSELEDLLESALSHQGREMVADPEPEKGFYYRSDQFEFAKVGVPALFINPGTKYIGQAAGYGRQKRDDYTAHDYHQVSDEIKPDWDLSGGAQDLEAVFEASLSVAEKSSYPEWKRGSEFKARREAMLK
jgi:Zn-dependent M28 family amino/carboxypeptidase